MSAADRQIFRLTKLGRAIPHVTTSAVNKHSELIQRSNLTLQRRKTYKDVAQ
jgi:hypothetical protein